MPNRSAGNREQKIQIGEREKEIMKRSESSYAESSEYHIGPIKKVSGRMKNMVY